ncbi:MAG: septum formation protein Maf [Anaerolineales bacterium]|nr:septum formation protein Maf [Anaerolineales bacterium]
MKLILASVSPRRRELLRQCGIDCDVMPVSADELAWEGETPGETALRLAREKGRLALERMEGRAGLILAADTVVADGGQLLGKPRDIIQAEAFLLQLRGREHRVITGVCLLRAPGGVEKTDLAVTAVRMREYSPAELAEYLASGDALDKAGAYAIQHPSFRPVESIAGCYTNVVGLPLCRVYALLEAAGETPDRPLPDGCRTGGACGFARLPE